MAGKLKAITQASFALVLALSLTLVPAVSVMALEESASISPETAEYNLDDPAEVTTEVTWGPATEIDAITDDDGYRLWRGLYYDYIVLGNTLVIRDSYLKDKLPDIGDDVKLIISFDVGGATFTITAIGSNPSIDPTAADYDLDDPEDVSTTIVWGAAAEVALIMDDEGDILQSGVDYDIAHISAYRAKLTISHDKYLNDKLEDIGESVALTIEFDRGDPIVFPVTAIGTDASISPQTREYDLEDPDDVKSTITWNAATQVESIMDGDAYVLLTPSNYSVGLLGADMATLTIRNSYLLSKLTDIGDSVVLTIEFDVGADATFTITAEGTQPKVSPPEEEYDLDAPAQVQTTIWWGAATEVESIVDGDGYELLPADYSLSGYGDTAALTVSNSYLASRFTDVGESLVLTIEFDVGTDATFTITAEGIQPRLSPPGEECDLDAPADVETTIWWGIATEVEAVVDDDGYKLNGGDYSVTDIDGLPTLTIFTDPYLKGKLTDVGSQAVLTIGFDVGTDATFTITAEGTQPRLSPPQEEYDLDAPADVETTIWWGAATKVLSILGRNESQLVENVDYSLTPIDDDRATLTIFHEPYLQGMDTDTGDSVVLTIRFDVNEVTFTITVIGSAPTISPATAEYGIIAQNNASTNITWGSATSVVSIVDGAGFALIEGEHYTVTPVDADSATLTILSDEYLQDKLRRVPREVVLTINFDVGSDTFTIKTIKECFIATAAYGTPMAQEIQTLREFRDKYLLTNPVGHALVDCYYKVSPPLAEFVTEHPSLKPVVRTGLLPAVTMSTMAVNATPVEKTAIVGLLALVSVALAVWATRRRDRGPRYTPGPN